MLLVYGLHVFWVRKIFVVNLQFEIYIHYIHMRKMHGFSLGAQWADILNF